MNFFQAQNKARHNTRLLTLLFVGAVVFLVVLTNLLVLLLDLILLVKLEIHLYSVVLLHSLLFLMIW